MTAREKIKKTGKKVKVLSFPKFRIDIDGLGNVYFKLTVTASQLTNANISKVQSELVTVFTAAIQRRAAEENVHVDYKAIRVANTKVLSVLRQLKRGAVEKYPELEKYFDTH
jgi:type VI protein secretion system component Hcp